MNKMKIKFAFIFFLLLIFGFCTSLLAKEKDRKLNLFLNLTSGLTYGAGADIKIYKFISIKPSIDLTSWGGRIIYFDTVLRLGPPKKIRPFFTVGYLDYYFAGNSSHDSDAVKGMTFGLGVDFYSRKGKHSSSVGIKIVTAEDNSLPLFYLNLIIARL